MFEQLIKTGLARYEYRHFIIFGSASEMAAVATECAGDQGEFWTFHDAYYSGDRTLFAREGVVAFAEETGLDLPEFETCLDGTDHLARIYAGQREARSLGISGTPTIMVNGQRVGSSIRSIIAAVDSYRLEQ